MRGLIALFLFEIDISIVAHFQVSDANLMLRVDDGPNPSEKPAETAGPIILPPFAQTPPPEVIERSPHNDDIALCPRGEDAGKSKIVRIHGCDYISVNID